MQPLLFYERVMGFKFKKEGYDLLNSTFIPIRDKILKQSHQSIN